LKSQKAKQQADNISKLFDQDDSHELDIFYNGKLNKVRKLADWLSTSIANANQVVGKHTFLQ
jgi:hypothetical protein